MLYFIGIIKKKTIKRQDKMEPFHPRHPDQRVSPGMPDEKWTMH